MIYLDHAATTPVHKKVFKAMKPYFSRDFGNPSSVHSVGRLANQAVEYARANVAEFLNCANKEIIFTSGATESNNLAIKGAMNAFKNNNQQVKPHIITSAIEHPAVLEVCQSLERQGVEVSYIKPDSNGLIRAQDVEIEIKPNTVLVSIMYVNNEIGTIQPIQEIGKLIKNINPQRQFKIYFHTDAVQAANYLDMDVENLGVDMLSMSGHKIYGPKGIGVLYVRQGTPIKNILYGGHQELGLRPGTLNTPAIVGMGQAVKLIKKNKNKKIKKLRDYTWQLIQENIAGVRMNGDLAYRISNNLNVSFQGVEGEALLLTLDTHEIAVSTGSACSSGSLEASHMLMSIGLSHEEAHGSLRITFGRDNKKKEIERMMDVLITEVNRLRGMAPELEQEESDDETE